MHIATSMRSCQTFTTASRSQDHARGEYPIAAEVLAGASLTGASPAGDLFPDHRRSWALLLFQPSAQKNAKAELTRRHRPSHSAGKSPTTAQGRPDSLSTSWGRGRLSCSRPVQVNRRVRSKDHPPAQCILVQHDRQNRQQRPSRIARSLAFTHAPGWC